jgi:hypothetical protein
MWMPTTKAEVVGDGNVVVDLIDFPWVLNEQTARQVVVAIGGVVKLELTIDEAEELALALSEVSSKARGDL